MMVTALPKVTHLHPLQLLPHLPPRPRQRLALIRPIPLVLFVEEGSRDMKTVKADLPTNGIKAIVVVAVKSMKTIKVVGVISNS